MSNPTKAPRTATSTLGRLLQKTQFQYVTRDHWADLKLPDKTENRRRRQPEYVVSELRSRDVVVMRSVRVPAVEFAPTDQEAALMARGKEVLYASPTDNLSLAHARHGPTVKLAVEMAERWDYGAPGVRGAYSPASVSAALRSGCMMSGGPQWSLGRLAKYLPAPGAVVMAPTRAELEAAMEGSMVWKPPEEGWRPPEKIMLNRDAELGFPFGGKGSNPEALDRHAKLSAQILARMRNEGAQVEYSRMMEKEPYLVLFKGKAKYDFYTLSKAGAGELRFYNVMPGWMKLALLPLTQSFEADCQPGPSTFQGRTLTRGGAAELVDRLNDELQRSSVAWVTCGDDTWVAVRHEEHVSMFALDCSSFDLTQHKAVTLPVHQEFRRRLAAYDPVLAELWFAGMRERLTTVSGSVVARMVHGGPSGYPLQSKVNDVLMQVFLVRLKAELVEHVELERHPVEDFAQFLEAKVLSLGRQLGLVVRLEQYSRARVRSLGDALATNPFLFVGYHFSTGHDDGLRVFADFPRMLRQLPYKSSQGWFTKEELDVRMVLKQAGVLLAAGIPADFNMPVFERALEEVRGALVRLQAVAPDVVRSVLGEFTFVEFPETCASLDGLVRALNVVKVREVWTAGAGPTLAREEVPLPKMSAGAWRPRETQVMEPASRANAGRPPRVTVRLAYRELVSEARRAGSVMALPKQKRERLLYLMQTYEEEDWEDETDWGASETGRDELDEWDDEVSTYSGYSGA